MQSTCPNCNKPVSPNDQTCGSCGFDLSPENTGITIVRLVPVILLILTFIGILVLLAYGSVTRYLTAQGVITTPLFWRPTSTITSTVTMTVTSTPSKTRVPRSTTTSTATAVLPSTATETFTATPIPTNTVPPSLTTTFTPIPSKTRPPSATPRPSATTKPASPTSTTSANPTAAGGATPTATTSGGSGPTATVGSLSDPAEFLRAYYTLINNHTYDQAWSWLSPNFITSKSSELGHTFSLAGDYIPYWNTVANVEILQAATESSTAENAVVNMQIRYNMTDGTSNVYNQRMSLIKSTTAQPWLIDTSQVSK